MKIKIAIYIALLIGSLIMAIYSLGGFDVNSGPSYSDVDNTRGGRPGIRNGEQERKYTSEELRTMGYNGEANSGWTLAGSEYDVRGANYTSDHYINRDWGWSELGGSFSEPRNSAENRK